MRHKENEDRCRLLPSRGQGCGRPTRVNSSIRLLETVAEHAADEFAWPAPFPLEMNSCGYPNARRDLATHKVTVCHELAADFVFGVDYERGPGEARPKWATITIRKFFYSAP